MKTPGIFVSAMALCLVALSCGKQQSSDSGAAPEAPPAPTLQIDRVEPSSTAVNTPFNVRPDKQSALAVFGKDIPAGTTVLWNDQALSTVVGGTFAAAVVPATLYATPGTVSIKLRTAGGALSNEQAFTIYGTTGPEPKVTQLYPGTIAPGKSFNAQPDGQSALGVAGENFLPGAALMWDGKKLTTVFGKGSGLSALVPGTLIAHAGSHQVWAVNPDGKASNKVEFKVGN